MTALATVLLLGIVLLFAVLQGQIPLAWVMGAWVAVPFILGIVVVWWGLRRK